MFTQHINSFKKSQKGASLVEFSLLLALLGSTSASMVFAFGQDIKDFYNAHVDIVDSHQSYAQSQGGDPVLKLEQGFIPDGQSGGLYTYDMAAHLTQAHFHPDASQTQWSLGALGTSLPPGLNLQPNTGRITGTPSTPGLYSFELIAIKGDSITIEEYLITINP